MTGNLISIAVLISGNGSNLQTIIDGCRKGHIAGKVCCVISNEAEAYGLERAKMAGIPAHVLSHTKFTERKHFDAALANLLETCNADLIVLAGFMRILRRDFVAAFPDRIINLHPSLLPRYKGLHTHSRVLADGGKVHGATVHFVTPDLDDGPVITQSSIPVEADDTAESLQQRVHELEHVILPRAISWFADGRLGVQNGLVLLDGESVPLVDNA